MLSSVTVQVNNVRAPIVEIEGIIIHRIIFHIRKRSHRSRHNYNILTETKIEFMSNNMIDGKIKDGVHKYRGKTLKSKSVKVIFSVKA